MEAIMFRPTVPQMLENRPNPVSYQHRELWCSVLQQAMNDLFGRQDETDKYSAHHKLLRHLNARAWFNSKRHEPRSFLWICDVLGIDPVRIRNKVLNG
jgi:hypothetical protein